MVYRNRLGDTLLEACSFLMVIGAAIVLWKEYGRIADEVAVHYNIWGEPDVYGNKSTLIVLLIINSVTYLLLTVLNRYPHLFNFPVKVTEYNRDVLFFYGKRMIRVLKCQMVFVFSFLIIHPIYFSGTSITFTIWSCLLLIVFTTIYYTVKLHKYR